MELAKESRKGCSLCLIERSGSYTPITPSMGKAGTLHLMGTAKVPAAKAELEKQSSKKNAQRDRN